MKKLATIARKVGIVYLIGFLTVTASSEASVYYVDARSPVASNSGPGTLAQPWKTIQKGAGTAIAGDTVYVKAGTYSGSVSVAHSGSDGGWITLSAYPGQEQQAIVSGAEIQVMKSYVRIHGFRVEHAPTEGILIQGPGVSHVRIDNNYTYDTGSSGIAAWGVEYGKDPNYYQFKCITNLIIENNTIDHANNPNLAGSGYNEQLDVANGVDTFEVRNNVIKNGNIAANGGEGIDCKEGVSNGKIWGNQVFNQPKYGIYIDAGANDPRIYSKPSATVNLQIFSNVIHDVYSAHGVGITSEGLGCTDGIYFYNNLVYNNGSDGILVYHYPHATGSFNNINIINNTVCGNATRTRYYGGIDIANDIATHVTVRNNIVVGNTAFQIKSTNADAIMDHNLTTGDPGFVAAGSANFHLTGLSEAIGAGANLTNLKIPLLGCDKDGTARPASRAWDIGAFQSR